MFLLFSYLSCLPLYLPIFFQLSTLPSFLAHLFSFDSSCFLSFLPPCLPTHPFYLSSFCCFSLHFFLLFPHPFVHPSLSPSLSSSPSSYLPCCFLYSPLLLPVLYSFPPLLGFLFLTSTAFSPHRCLSRFLFNIFSVTISGSFFSQLFFHTSSLPSLSLLS